MCLELVGINLKRRAKPWADPDHGNDFQAGTLNSRSGDIFASRCQTTIMLIVLESRFALPASRFRFFLVIRNRSDRRQILLSHQFELAPSCSTLF